MIVVADTSTFLAVALKEPERSSILRATENCDLVAPAVLPFEIGNALTALVKRGLLQPDQVLAAWDAVQRIPVELRDVHMPQALSLAVSKAMYAYDAYFLECSLRLRCPLLTLDRRMQAIAEELGLTVLEVRKP